jgi:hypothetical protein
MPHKKPGVIVQQTAVEVTVVKVRVLPNGNMDVPNASKYSGYAKQTLAQWRSQKRGPPYVKIHGKIFYPKPGMDNFLAGE